MPVDAAMATNALQGMRTGRVNRIAGKVARVACRWRNTSAAMALEGIVRNHDNDPDSLLNRARAMRIEAARAMEAAQKATSEDVHADLTKQAANSLAQALELEQRAFTNVPPPRAQVHANPQQMQQAQLTPGTPGDDDEKPGSSKRATTANAR